MASRSTQYAVRIAMPSGQKYTKGWILSYSGHGSNSVHFSIVPRCGRFCMGCLDMRLNYDQTIISCTRTCSIVTRDQQQEEQLKSPNLHVETRSFQIVKLSSHVPTHYFLLQHYCSMVKKIFCFITEWGWYGMRSQNEVTWIRISSGMSLAT